MKKLSLLLSFYLLSGLLYAQNIKALDDKNGFRDYKFGIDTTSIPNLNYIDSDGGVRVYEKTDEKLSIGETPLKSIQYGFYKNRLYCVFIKTEGLSNSRSVLSALRELYGDGYKPNQFMDKYDWFGKLVTMIYDENSITGGASVLLLSVPINDQKKIDQKDQAKKAKGDL